MVFFFFFSPKVDNTVDENKAGTKLYFKSFLLPSVFVIIICKHRR